MITKNEINNILSKYDKKNVKIGTICSHSALQIFHGAKKEGFKTLGICIKNRKIVYDSFPLAKPDTFIIVEKFSDILKSSFQERMIAENTIIIPHGSFVEYVGPENLEKKFYVPMFGNRKTLEWEKNRNKQRQWLETAGLTLPKAYKSPSEIDDKVFIKLPGAKGGRGFFTVSSEKELYKKLDEKVKKGLISKSDSENITIQEFISGVRYYPHYFYSLFKKEGATVEDGRVGNKRN